MPQENLYVFNHVPKTAGTAFKKFLSSNVESGRFLDIIHPNKDEVGRVIEACDLSDYDWICANFHNEQIARVRELSGRRLKVVTILRDPVERGLSLYRFIKNKKIHALYEMVSRMSLTEFVSSTDLTRQLSEYYTTRFGSGRLEAAIEFLEHDKLVVGVTEEMDRTMAFIGEALEFEHLHVPNANVSKRFDELDVSASEVARAREILGRRNDLDQQLYGHFRSALWA